MAASEQNFSKMTSAQLRFKANEFLNSRKNADNLPDILQVFEVETENFTPVLLAIEVIFTELLKRGDLTIKVVPLKSSDLSPEAQYKEWLNDCYETAIVHATHCVKKGKTTSRLQALVTLCKFMQAEGKYPLIKGHHFPSVRLKNIFLILLDSKISMSAQIMRFQEFTEYRDVQQFGLKILCSIAYRKSPTRVFIQNFLELFDKLLTSDMTISHTTVKKAKGTEDIKEENLLCLNKDNFQFSPSVCKRYANLCWGYACHWPLCEDQKIHHRALMLLVERLMPLLNNLHLVTDMLCDSLDAGGPISMLGLQGVLELVQRHNITYPDIYDRLYAMFEPEMFATRYKKRFIHLSDIFLSSTHLPESMVAAFAKRISRLALVASPDDARSLLQLIANLLLRHPALKRMICSEDTPAIMSNDPYVMEETSTTRSNALGSSLWEVRALCRHWAPEVMSAATRVLASHGTGDPPASLAPPDDNDLFNTELKKRFKTIEINFIRPDGMRLPSGDRLMNYWELTA